MRRLSAIILLIPLCILFMGAVNLSSVCPVTQPGSCTTATHATTATHPTTSTNAATATHTCCHGEKASCPNNRKADRSACCFDCPLCALITNPAFIRFELTRPETRIEYAVRPDNSLTDYDQHHWKPPDKSSFS
jgi:hypothetical protein